MQKIEIKLVIEALEAIVSIASKFMLSRKNLVLQAVLIGFEAFLNYVKEELGEDDEGSKEKEKDA